MSAENFDAIMLARHIANLRRLQLQQRRDYMRNLERRDGAEVASKVRAAFSADWEMRKVQE